MLKVTNDDARAFYEIEAAREGWSSRELERQVGSLLFERLARSRDKQKVLAQARRGAQPESPADVIKEPFVLEFRESPSHLGVGSGWNCPGSRRVVLARPGAPQVKTRPRWEPTPRIRSTAS